MGRWVVAILFTVVGPIGVPLIVFDYWTAPLTTWGAVLASYFTARCVIEDLIWAWRRVH